MKEEARSWEGDFLWQRGKVARVAGRTGKFVSLGEKRRARGRGKKKFQDGEKGKGFQKEGLEGGRARTEPFYPETQKKKQGTKSINQGT